MRGTRTAERCGGVVSHKVVEFCCFFRVVDGVRLIDPSFLRPGKLGDRVVDPSGISRTNVSLPVIASPSSSDTRRTASQIDSAVDGVVVGEIDDRVLLGCGLEDMCLMLLSYSVEIRIEEFCEGTPSRRIESLDDKKDQEEVRQVPADGEFLFRQVRLCE